MLVSAAKILSEIFVFCIQIRDEKDKLHNHNFFTFKIIGCFVGDHYRMMVLHIANKCVGTNPFKFYAYT
jgi:hypothetical protein